MFRSSLSRRAVAVVVVTLPALEAYAHLFFPLKSFHLFLTDTPECYYYDLIDLLRRLILTGGLIMIGDQAVAQVFLGILVSAMWLCLVLYKRPYASAWDTALSAVLSFSLLITLTTGVCLKLFEITKDEADEYQKNAFAVMLIVSISICVLLSVASIVFSTECLRDRAAACAAGLSKSKRETRTAVLPTGHGDSDAAFEESGRAAVVREWEVPGGK